MKLSMVQKLGLAPLTIDQEIEKVMVQIVNIEEANDLPEWAYTDEELEATRDSIKVLEIKLEELKGRL